MKNVEQMLKYMRYILFILANVLCTISYAQNSPDVNDDGVINSADIVLVNNRIVAGPNSYSQYNTDVDGDGYVNSADIVYICNAVLNGWKKPVNKQFVVNGVSFTMIYVAGGSFNMGTATNQGGTSNNSSTGGGSQGGLGNIFYDGTSGSTSNTGGSNGSSSNTSGTQGGLGNIFYDGNSGSSSNTGSSQGGLDNIFSGSSSGGTSSTGGNKGGLGNIFYDINIPLGHKVILPNYLIGETEVTQALWKAVMGKNPSNTKSTPFDEVGSNLPVESVSWNDCQEFISKLNALTGKKFRLPTEAEWEFAAMGGKKSNGYIYSGSDNLSDVAWSCTNSRNFIHTVKTKRANELGIYDMSGNVSEWCQDWYGDYNDYTQTNPQGPNSGYYRVVRGGAWYQSAGGYCPADRSKQAPTYRSGGLGLRLCLSE